MSTTIEELVRNYKEVIEKAEMDKDYRDFIMDCFDIDFFWVVSIDFVIEHVHEIKALQDAGLGCWYNLAKNVSENMTRLIEAGYDENEVLETAVNEINNNTVFDNQRRFKKAIANNSVSVLIAELVPNVDPSFLDRIAAQITEIHNLHF